MIHARNSSSSGCCMLVGVDLHVGGGRRSGELQNGRDISAARYGHRLQVSDAVGQGASRKTRPVKCPATGGGICETAMAGPGVSARRTTGRRTTGPPRHAATAPNGRSGAYVNGALFWFCRCRATDPMPTAEPNARPGQPPGQRQCIASPAAQIGTSRAPVRLRAAAPSRRSG